jgi:hypothetical protein
MSSDSIIAVRRRQHVRDVALSLSLANLYFLGVWLEILPYGYRTSFFRPGGPGMAHFVAGLFNVTALAALFWGASQLLRRHARLRRGVAAAGLLFPILLMPLKNLQTILAEHYEVFRVGTSSWISVALALVLIAFLFSRWARGRASMLRASLLCLGMLVPLHYGLAIWGAARAGMPSVTVKEHVPAPPAPAAGAAGRLVWIIFDEWDYRLTFDGRAPDLELPELDRFARTAVFADRAYPPAGRTLLSVPALLAGKLASAAFEDGQGKLMVHFDGEPAPSVWSGNHLPFREVAAQGGRSAVAGWYFPYCDVVDRSVASTSVEPNGPGGFPAKGEGFLAILVNQWRSLVETQRLSPFGQSLTTIHHRESVELVLARARAAAMDPQYQFVFLHLPIPHPPYFYDRRSGAFSLIGSAESRYLDSLALADLTLGTIRAGMERAGVWDGSTILLSSDHWDRLAAAVDGRLDHRIPFMLKLPGQTRGLAFHEPFNTVLSRGLLFAIQRGEVREPEQAAQWLSLHRRGLAESPYNAD